MTGPVNWTPAILFDQDGDRLRCDLCPHACRLDDGEVGLCRVRRRSGDILETATFATAVRHIDAIERKPLYHFRPGAMALTLAAPGCTFLCSYCINYRISQYGRPAGTPWAAEPVDVQDVVGSARAIDGVVALSYTEPALAIELTLELAEAGRSAGVAVVWKSNGFLTERAVAAVAPVLAAVNIDLKAPDEDRHRRLTGGALAPVLRTIAALREAGVWVEVSTPVIPGNSDTVDDLSRIARHIADIDAEIPWHLLRFTPTFRMSDRDPTSPALLAEGVGIGRSAGLRHVYVERALGDAGRQTECPACDAVVVRRDVWRLAESLLVSGACPTCATPIAGRW